MNAPASLSEFRQRREISLEAAGALFAVNKTTFMRWEAGRVPAERVLEIERVTGVPRHSLRGDLYPPPVTVAEGAAA